MDGSSGVNLKQLAGVAGGLDDQASIIMNGDQVVEGKTFGYRLSRLLHKAPESHQQIWSNLKVALSNKYDSSIASRVMGRDTDTSKPLTARMAKKILRSANDLQIQKELTGINLERSEILDVENQRKELPGLKSDMETLKNQWNETQEQFDLIKGRMDETVGDDIGGLMDEAVQLSQLGETQARKVRELEQKVSRLTRLEEAGPSRLAKKSILNIKQMALSCKSEMLNIPAKPPMLINTQSLIRSGKMLTMMATDFTNLARELYANGDLNGLKQLTQQYQITAKELTRFYNDNVKAGLPEPGGYSKASDAQAVKSFGQRVTRFTFLLIDTAKVIGTCLAEPESELLSSRPWKLLGRNLDETVDQLKGNINDGSSHQQRMVDRLGEIVTRMEPSSEKDSLLDIMEKVEGSQFEDARRKMERYVDQHGTEDIGLQYMNLVNLCILKEANPDFFSNS